MFTGIVQEVATIANINDHAGLRTFEIKFPEGFCDDLEIGASVAVDGVCLTVTERTTDNQATFDVMLQSLNVTTLGDFRENAHINVERAAKEGAEIGGHPLSGHIDFKAEVVDITKIDDNYRMRFGFANEWGKYIFPKGYIAVNGCSLTIADVDKQANYFEVWLIPETLRATTFNEKQVGDQVNVEIERETQVIVDTIERTLEEKLGALYPMLEKLMAEQEVSLAQDLTTQDVTSSIVKSEDKLS